VTITGTLFGNSQGDGTVLLGSTAGQVVSWGDTQVVGKRQTNQTNPSRTCAELREWDRDSGYELGAGPA